MFFLSLTYRRTYCIFIIFFHSSSGKTIEFSPHDVVIQDLHDSEMIVATGSVDSASRLYRFDGFESSNDVGSCLVVHAESISRL